MQEPTHILTGVIIQKSFDNPKHRQLALGLTAVLAFLSHGFLDKLANLTYHPANPEFTNPVWIIYHLFIVGATVVFLVLWWKKFKWGIIFACLPDLDWVFIHGREFLNWALNLHLNFYPHPYLHMFLGNIWKYVPPFSFVTPYLDHLPNFRHKPIACLFEFALVAFLLLVLKLITMGQRPHRSSQETAPINKKEIV